MTLQRTEINNQKLIIHLAQLFKIVTIGVRKIETHGPQFQKNVQRVNSKGGLLLVEKEIGIPWPVKNEIVKLGIDRSTKKILRKMQNFDHLILTVLILANVSFSHKLIKNLVLLLIELVIIAYDLFKTGKITKKQLRKRLQELGISILNLLGFLLGSSVLAYFVSFLYKLKYLHLFGRFSNYEFLENAEVLKAWNRRPSYEKVMMKLLKRFLKILENEQFSFFYELGMQDLELTNS